MLSGRQEFVARVDAVSTDHLDVTLFDGETNVNLELGATATAPAAAPEKSVPPPVASEAAPAAPAPCPQPRSVCVSFTVSPGELYVQDAAAADQLDELMTRLDTEYSQLADGERAVAEVRPAGRLVVTERSRRVVIDTGLLSLASCLFLGVG